MNKVLRLFAAVLLAAVSLTVLGCSTGRVPLYQGCGVKVGEIDQTSGIVWTRLTQLKDQRDTGFVIDKSDVFGKAADSPKKYSKGVDPAMMLGAVPGIAGEVRLSYSENGGHGKAVRTPWVSVDKSSDFTHKFNISGLKPATKYNYKVACRSNSTAKPGQSVKGSFKTAPPIDKPAPVMFTVVTGHKFRTRDRRDGHQIFSVMADMKPDFFVHTGDYVYMEEKWINNGSPAEAMEHARLQWQRMHGLNLQKEFYRFVPAYMMKDDHDIGVNDTDPTKSLPGYSYRQGIDMFNEQMPTGNTPYRTRRWGKDLQIWMVEGRDFRSPNAMADGPGKTIWGKKQFDWLKKSVKASDAAFKVLISPTPIVGPDRGNKKDNYANVGFKYEGDKVRQWIHDEAPELFLVCGDRHWQYVSVHPETGVREYSCGSTSDKHAGGWKAGFDKEYHRYLNVIGGFLSVTVERVNGTPNIVFRHHDVEGKVRNEDRHLPGSKSAYSPKAKTCPSASEKPCPAKKCGQDCAKPCCGGVALFDGKSFDGWTQKGGKAKYEIVDGTVVGTTVTGTPNSFLCTKKHYENFILLVDFKVDEGLNSGIQIRSNSFKDYKDGRVHGYQVEIDPKQSPYNGKRAGVNLMEDGSEAPKDAPRSWTGGIYDEGRSGWLYPLNNKPKARAAFKPGQWNHFKIIANGDSIKTWVNGIPAADLKDETTKTGFIALQVHSTKNKEPHQVRWKNIFLKELK